ncbi:MAG TPA: pilin [Candidatus Saccharimonadales bacterium]|jgi:FtsH-binding integral membrane protein
MKWLNIVAGVTKSDLVNIPTAELNDAQFTSLFNGVLAVAGMTAIIFIILGGLKYTTSEGNPGELQKAKDMIVYALVGLVVVIFAFTIVQFVTFRVF